MAVEQRGKTGAPESEVDQKAMIRSSDTGVYTYENPDGSIIQLVYKDGVVVTVALASQQPDAAA